MIQQAGLPRSKYWSSCTTGESSSHPCQRSFFLQQVENSTWIHNKERTADCGVPSPLTRQVQEILQKILWEPLNQHVCWEIIFSIMTGKLHSRNLNNMVISTRQEQWRHQLAWQSGWGKSQSHFTWWRATGNYWLYWEGEPVFPRDEPPNWLSNAEDIHIYVYEKHSWSGFWATFERL